MARFTHVGLGLELGVLATYEEERDPSAVIFGGPLVGGTEVEVTLDVGSLATVLVGRLVDEAGAPLAAREFDATVSDLEGQESWNETTDEAGEFRLRFDPDEVPQDYWSLSIRPVPPEDEEEAVDGTEAAASADPERDPAGLEAFTESLFAPVPGPNDLGTLTCEPRPLLVAGRVVDENGTGLEDVMVTVGLELLNDEDPSNNRYWDGADLTPGTDRETTSDENGEFALYGRVGDPRRWPGWTTIPAIKAEAEGITNTDPVTFAQGERDVELEVLVAGSVEGRFEVDDERVLDVLRTSLQHGGPGQLERKWIQRNGSEFERQNLRPGSWDLVVEYANEGGEILRIPSIQVPRGAVAEDDRLDPIDLSHMRRLRIDVDGVGGPPISAIMMQRRLPGENEWGQVERMRLEESDGGRYLALITAHVGLDLRIAAEQYRAQELTNVVDDRDVTLTAGIRVDLTADAALLDELEEGVVLYARLDSEGLGGNVRFGDLSPAVPKLTQRVAEEGSYVLRAWVYRPGQSDNSWRGRRSRRTMQALPLDQTLDVSENAAPVQARLDLTRDALLQAQERLLERPGRAGLSPERGTHATTPRTHRTDARGRRSLVLVVRCGIRPMKIRCPLSGPPRSMLFLPAPRASKTGTPP